MVVPQWSPGAEPLVGVWGQSPQKLNNTRGINANFKWKCNKVTVKHCPLLRIEVRLTALTLDLDLQSRESYGHTEV